MTSAQLAAVSYLARHSGLTHSLYARQLRQWFTWRPTTTTAAPSHVAPASCTSCWQANACPPDAARSEIGG